jgi:malate synthase
VTKELFRTVLSEELGKIKSHLGPAYDKLKFDLARDLFEKITTDDHFVEFLTLPGYDHLD